MSGRRQDAVPHLNAAKRAGGSRTFVADGQNVHVRDTRLQSVVSNPRRDPDRRHSLRSGSSLFYQAGGLAMRESRFDVDGNAAKFPYS
jgi:hypothetical protein